MGTDKHNVLPMVFQLPSDFNPSRAFDAIVMTGLFILDGNALFIAKRKASILLREKAITINKENKKRNGITVMPINTLGCIFKVVEKYDRAFPKGRNIDEYPMRISKVKESKSLSTTIVLRPVEGDTFSLRFR